MPFKPNYRHERAERDRLKKAKKEEKLKQRQERVAAEGEAAGEPVPAADERDGPSGA